MKKSVKIALSTMVCAVLCAAFTSETPLNSIASAQTTSSDARTVLSADPAGLCDFSRRGYASVSIDGAALTEQVIGSSVGDLERQYLLSHSDFALKYNENIGASYIIAELENGLTLTASEYSYAAANGQTVTWYPASVNGTPFKEGYVWNTVNVPAEDYVTVTYETSLKIDKSVINTILNQTYKAAVAADAKIKQKDAEYAAASAQYLADVQAYEKFVADSAQYESDLAVYDAYLAAYAEWETACADYAAYLAACAEYESALAEYDDYLAELAQYESDLEKYRAYLTALAQYEEKYAEFQKNPDFEKLQTVRAQLSILDFISTPVRLDRTLRGAIMGSTVTSVLDNKDALVENLGVEEKPIDVAAAATENLRRLITSYESCKTEEEQYLFYITCYDELVRNFDDLLRALDYLYRYNVVKNAISSQNKTEQYRILLAQLYVICNALDDNPVGNYDMVYKQFDKSNAAYYDASWLIDGMTPLKVLGDVVYLVDKDNATPLDTGYPSNLSEPVKPEEVAAPVPPARVTQPTPPAVVEKPQEAPEEVAAPTAPEPVAEPDEEPQPYVPTDEENALAAAYSWGNIVERPELTEDFSLELRTEVEKQFRNVTEVTVYFYSDESSSTPAYIVTAAVGSAVEYVGAIPEKTRTGYACEFDYWMDGDGNEVDIGKILTDKSDLKLYPHFNETANLYPVTWNIDGVAVTELVPYGQTPVYSGVPEKSAEGPRLYRFTGWDKEIVPVDENGAEYAAVFEESLIVVWSLYGGDTSVSVWKGELPVFDGIAADYCDSTRYYTFSGWDREVAAAQEDAVYTAVYASRYLVPLTSGGARVTLLGGYYVADCSSSLQSGFDLSVLFSLAAENGCGVTLKLSNASLSFGKEDVLNLTDEEAFRLSFEILQTATYSYRYKLAFTGVDGEIINPEYNPSVTVSGVFDAAYCRLYRVADDLRTEVECTVGKNEVSFTANGSAIYEIYPVFSVKIISSQYVEITADAAEASVGAKITLSLGEVAEGMSVADLYVVDAYGNDVTVSGNTFRMPLCDVTVGVVCVFIEYTVTFISEGKILSSRIYSYGDEIAPPPDPVKPSDGQYIYTFEGWSEEVGTVTGDMTFTARFSAEPVPEKVSGGPSKLKILLDCLYAAVIILCVLLIGTVVFVVVRVVRKKSGGKSRKDGRRD